MGDGGGGGEDGEMGGGGGGGGGSTWNRGVEYHGKGVEYIWRVGLEYLIGIVV